MVIAGDYSEQFKNEAGDTLYTQANDFPVLYYDFKNETVIPKETIRRNFDWSDDPVEGFDSHDEYTVYVEEFYKDKVFYSLDKRQYLHLGNYFARKVEARKNTNQWVEHPVTIMLATEVGGGGDFYTSYKGGESVGLFTGDKVGIGTLKDVEGFKDIAGQICFNEQMKRDDNKTMTEVKRYRQGIRYGRSAIQNHSVRVYEFEGMDFVLDREISDSLSFGEQFQLLVSPENGHGVWQRFEYHPDFSECKTWKQVEALTLSNLKEYYPL